MVDALLAHRPEQRFGELVASPAADHQQVGGRCGVEQCHAGIPLDDSRDDLDLLALVCDISDRIVKDVLCKAPVVDVMDGHRKSMVGDDGLDHGIGQAGFADRPRKRGL